MSLHFPNSSRSFDASKTSISFWGHDSTREITFNLDESALRKLNPLGSADEATYLKAFDANRTGIQKAAAGAYARKKQSYLWLSADAF